MDIQTKCSDIIFEILNATNDAEQTFSYRQPNGKANATALIERAVEEEAVKIALFKGKESYRIIAKDSITIFTPEKQPTELESSYLESEGTQKINKTAVENLTPNTEAISKSLDLIWISTQWKIVRKKKVYVLKSSKNGFRN